MSADTDKKNNEPAADGPELPMNTIQVSALNPRHGLIPDIETLKASIKTSGQLNPIFLRVLPEGGHEVVIGSRRFAALREERGEDGVLKAGEYRVVDWDDDKCIRAAMNENCERMGLSPFETGRYLDRLAARTPGVTEEKLAEMTGLKSRQKINQLRNLTKGFDRLPDAWKAELVKPSRTSDKLKPKVQLSHFKLVQALIPDSKETPLPEGLEEAMAGVVKYDWSVAEFEDELKARDLRGPAPAKGGGKKTKLPPYQNALKLLKNVAGACGDLPEAAELIRKAQELISQKQQEILDEAKKQEAKAKEEAKQQEKDRKAKAIEEAQAKKKAEKEALREKERARKAAADQKKADKKAASKNASSAPLTTPVDPVAEGSAPADTETEKPATTEPQESAKEVAA